MHEKSKKIDCCMEKFEEALDVVLAKGIFDNNVCGEELGALTDMIKDMAEAKEKLWKACYYETIVEAMKEEETVRRGEYRSGYDNWRYASGRFAPKGHGHLSGYMPDMYLEDETSGYTMPHMSRTQVPSHRMGYDHDEMMEQSPHGRAFDEWQQARRHYTETNSDHDREMMDKKADEHVLNTMASIRTLYNNGDPALKKHIKENFTKLITEMT